MPLPPLAPSSTVRYFLDYTSMEIEHTVQFRFSEPLTDVASTFNGLITAMVQCMRQADAINGIREAAQGSDVTFPVLQGGFQGTLSNASAIADDPESVFISLPFRGRPSGRKGRYDFFFSSSIIPLDLNNRFPVGTVLQLTELEEALTNLSQPSETFAYLVDISGSAIIFNGYWNRAKSGYWQRRQRLG